MVTESIFDGKTFIIPMADIVAIEKLNPVITPPFSYRAIMAGTTFNHEARDYNNDILLKACEGKGLVEAWCKYRYELEKSFMETETATGITVAVDGPATLTADLETTPGIHVENINVNFTSDFVSDIKDCKALLRQSLEAEKKVRDIAALRHTEPSSAGKNEEYPKIMTSLEGNCIVAFIAKKQGYILKTSPNAYHKEGEFRNDFVDGNFKFIGNNFIPMNGTNIFNLINGVIKSVLDFSRTSK